MQPLQLSIPKPCHEDWQQMTPTEKGRFCNACAKQVIDFSTMTDKEVLNYFFTIKDENICGRALPSQLERTIDLPRQPVKTRYWYWNYITLLFLFFNKTSAAKITNRQTISSSQLPTKSTLNDIDIPKTKQGEIKRTQQIIAGKITDWDGNGIPAVHVKIKGSDQSVISDAYGVYSILADLSHDTIELSAVGYQPASISLATRQSFNFSLSKSIAGEMVIVTGGIRRKQDLNKTITIPAQIKISGVITDKDGTPVQFATVKLKQKRQAVMADESGKFSMVVTEVNSVLEISAVGFKPTEWTPGAKQDKQTIILERMSSTTLEEAKVAAGSFKGKVCTVRVGGLSVGRTIRKESVADSLRSFFTVRKSALRIFPNPVDKGNTFTLSLQLKMAGNHYVQITDATGRIMIQQSIHTVSNQHNETIQTSSRWSSGIYYIRVFDNSNLLVGSNSFIVQ